MEMKIKTFCRICGTEIEEKIRYNTEEEKENILHDLEEDNFCCSENCRDIYVQEIEGIDL